MFGILISTIFKISSGSFETNCRCAAYKKSQPHKQHIWFLPTQKPTLKKPKELFFFQRTHPNSQEYFYIWQKKSNYVGHNSFNWRYLKRNTRDERFSSTRSTLKNEEMISSGFEPNYQRKWTVFKVFNCILLFFLSFSHTMDSFQGLHQYTVVFL